MVILRFPHTPRLVLYLSCLLCGAALVLGCQKGSDRRSPVAVSGDSLLTTVKTVKYEDPASALAMAQEGLSEAEKTEECLP